MTTRIGTKILEAYLNDVIVGAARQASQPTDENLAAAIHGTNRFFRVRGADTLERSRLTADERADLARPASIALADKYGSAWGVTADGIRAALSQLPEHLPVMPLAEFVTQNGALPTTPNDWMKKAVWGSREIRLASDSMTFRRIGPPQRIAVEGSPSLANAIRGLRYVEAYRDAILRNYIVQPGDYAPELDTASISLTCEELRDQAKRDGHLNERGFMADPQLIAAIKKHLPDWTAGFVPYAPLDTVVHRASATDMYEAVQTYMIPAYVKALTDLGAVVR